MHDAQEIITYWFGELSGPTDMNKDASRKWFMSTRDDDDEMRERFGASMEAAERGDLDDWAETAHGRLALVLLLDQMSRNIHRGTAQAFAYDDKAYALAREGVERGHDQELFPIQRVFFYMPYEHQESLEAQRECVVLMGKVGEGIEGPSGDHLRGYVKYARDHEVIIEQFGRFPHRNKVLGRTSTPEEIAYMEGGGATFGQG